MNLHWSIYLLVGLCVTLVSSFREGLGIFIIVGVIFMAVGIGKWISHRPVDLKKRDRFHTKYVKCSACRAWNYPHASTCHHCNSSMNSALQ